MDIFSLHREEYGVEPEIVVRAPGRVVLLGEHGAGCNGLLLGFAVDRYVNIAVSSRKDSSLRFYAAALNERKRTNMNNLKYRREDRWANYEKAVLYALRRQGNESMGLSFTVVDEIPRGAGFASSSAAEVATAMCVMAVKGLEYSHELLIDAVQHAESDFMGRHSGVLPHVMIAKARKNRMFVADAKRLQLSHVPMDLGEHALVITDSGMPRGSANAELASRKHDCRHYLESFESLMREQAGRHVRAEEIADSLGSLPEDVRRRCIHIVMETHRVREAAHALTMGEIEAFARTINHSQESLRDYYEVSCPEIDWLVKRSLEIEGCLASRMIGPGFGGSMISLMRPDSLPEYRRKLEEYERIFGFKTRLYWIESSDGACLVHERKLDAAIAQQ